MKYHFQTDDIVEQNGHGDTLLVVTGVIHDRERLFVMDPTGRMSNGKEFELWFGEVTGHWRKKEDSNMDHNLPGVAAKIANISSEAWTVYMETGLTPRQLVEQRKELVAALEQIRDAERDICRRCEGNGALYADGKAHYYSEHAPTIPCGHCGGSGRLMPEDASEIAAAALAKTEGGEHEI